MAMSHLILDYAPCEAVVRWNDVVRRYRPIFERYPDLKPLQLEGTRSI
jgi:hypothetical protein